MASPSPAAIAGKEWYGFYGISLLLIGLLLIFYGISLLFNFCVLIFCGISLLLVFSLG